MINAVAIEQKIRAKYLNLESVTNGVFRAVDQYKNHQYAVRYFDLNDQIIDTADRLRQYLETVLSDRFFSGQTATDLRWNHYLYFVTSVNTTNNQDYKRAKAKVESDREYARKMVILEDDLDTLLKEQPASYQAMPDDLATIWMKGLEEKGLVYVLDESVSAPEAARLIAAQRKQNAEKIATPLELTSTERFVSQSFIKNISIEGFRTHPLDKEHSFGKVNLIIGTNGVGKTSLLDAIEYLFCGQTNRPGELIGGTAISSELVGCDDSLTTSTSTPLQQLRARHSNWYAKSEINTLTLSKSFAKFNYLDTDAAVHLSVDNSQEQIGPDVTRLILGSEAEKLSDKLTRVKTKLEEFAKDYERNIASNKTLLETSQQRLDSLRKAPQISDTLHSELNIVLKQLNWYKLPTTKIEAIAGRENIQQAYTYIKILERSPISILATDEISLSEMRRTINAGIETAINLVDRQKIETLNLSQVQRHLTATQNRLQAVNTLLLYIEADYFQSMSELQQLLEESESDKIRLSIFSETDIRTVLEDISEYELKTAAGFINTSINEQDKKLHETRQTLKAIEVTNSTLNVLRQRILSLTQELLEKGLDRDHCPVCHAHYDEGELELRMFSEITDTSESQLVELQKNIRNFEQTLSLDKQKLTYLRQLITFVEYQNIRTVGDAINYMEEVKHKVDLKSSRINELEEQFKNLSKQGLNKELFNNSLAVIEVSPQINIAELINIKSETNEQLLNFKNSQALAQKSLETVESDREKLAVNFSIDISTTSNDLIQMLSSLGDSLDEAIAAKKSISQLMNLDDKALEFILVQIEQAQLLLQKLVTAVATEEDDSKSINSEVKNIEKYQAKNSADKDVRDHLKNTSEFFEMLIKQGTGGELASKILAENASEISRIFAAIHMPNEFEIKTIQGKLFIIRRETGKAIKLGEMSTGQRAAYALSLFLAMNSRLNNGPRVLLFDDPIAHVDDINVLSFLDHLRDIAIGGSRQIFFATADNKLAGLFRQKFKFLGNQDFREISLNRD